MDPSIIQKTEAFFAQYPARHYPKGHILIGAHDDPSHVFRLREGKIKQYDISYRGDEVVLNVFKPPAFFPMSYAINRTPNVYFYAAGTDVELQLAPLDKTVDFVRSNPDVLFDLLSRVYKGTDGLLGRIAHLMTGTARSRVLYELLIEYRRFGQPQDGKVSVALTEAEIGARAGLARETVSREMHKLKEEGFISVVKHEIVVSDIEQLAALISRDL